MPAAEARACDELRACEVSDDIQPGRTNLRYMHAHEVLRTVLPSILHLVYLAVHELGTARKLLAGHVPHSRPGSMIAQGEHRSVPPEAGS